MKLDDATLERIRAADAAVTRASLDLSAATVRRMEVEAAERKAAARAMEASRAMGRVIREAALKAGIDPDKPFRFDLAAGTMEQ